MATRLRGRPKKYAEYEELVVGVADGEDASPITGFEFLDAILAIHICGIVGILLHALLQLDALPTQWRLSF